MTIKQLPEVVNGRVKASVEKVDASLIDLAPTGNAIVATTEGLKVDLSGYATSVDLTNAIAAAQLEGKEVDLSGLATKTELNDAITEITTGMPLLVDTKVNTAIASVVDNAPATFDTLKEIATWIETEGVDTASLTASIAVKADKTEVDGKVDKVDGKGLSTNDFTGVYKDQLDNMTTTVDTQIDNKFNTVYGPSIAANLEGINTQLGTKLDQPAPTAPSTTAPSLENSLPLYTLGNNGEYVLCTPDTWFLINGFYVPGYSATTLGV